MIFAPESIHPYGSFWLDFADKAIKGIAVIVGALWTYFNTVRARTYRRKLELSLSGKIVSKNEKFYVLVLCLLKNVGQAKYVIEQKGTYVGVLLIPEDDGTPEAILEVFKDHAWIEPGEQIQEPLVLSIPNPETFFALRLKMRIVSEQVEWNYSCIVTEEPISEKAVTLEKERYELR